MKYIKYYDERSQYTSDTDFYFPFVGFQSKTKSIAGSRSEISVTDTDVIKEEHSLHLLKEDYLIKCEYIPAEEVILFNRNAVQNIICYIYDNNKYGCLYKIEDSNILTFDSVPDKNITVYFLLRNRNCIPNNMFCDCHNLVNVTFTNYITRIGKNAFFSCKSLQEINIPDTCTYIASRAFANCNKVTKIHFGSNLQYIGDLAFLMSSKHVKDVTFENMQCFDKLSNKHGILFKPIKMRCSQATNYKTLNLAEYFTPDFFANMSNTEKTRWANLLCGDFLGSIYYNDDTVNIKSEKKNNIYSVVIPEGVKNINSYSIFVEFRYPNENIETRMNTVNAFYAKYNHIKKFHIPNSVSTFDFVRNVKFYLVYAGITPKMIFYTDIKRHKKFGMTASSLHELLGHGILHVSNYLYYKFICNRNIFGKHKKYNRWAYWQGSPNWINMTPLIKRHSTNFWCKSIFEPTEDAVNRTGKTNKYVIMPFTRSIATDTTYYLHSSRENIIYSVIIARRNTDNQLCIMLLNRSASKINPLIPRRYKRFVYNIYPCRRTPYDDKYRGYYSPIAGRYYSYPQYYPDIDFVEGDSKQMRRNNIPVLDMFTITTCNITHKCQNFTKGADLGNVFYDHVVSDTGVSYTIERYRQTTLCYPIYINVDK